METTTPSPPWAANSSYHMIDVGPKTATVRRAVAQGSIRLTDEAFVALRDGKNPKGNVLALAEAAGIMAAKMTAQYIPLCHPLPLDFAHVSFELNHATNSVMVFCEVGTTAKTGVEMEALCGVNGALLTIYDLSKAVNPVLTISDVRLNLKEGGKSGIWKHPEYQPAASSAKSPSLTQVRASVITISDRVSAGKNEDRSGPLLNERLKAEGAECVAHLLVPDEVEKIQGAIHALIEKHKVQLIITTGGTGLSPRDVTPEALESMGPRKLSGFGELLRQDGSRFKKTAWLSRSNAYVLGETLIVTLPGSRNAVNEGMDVLLPLLPHALHTLKGGDHA